MVSWQSPVTWDHPGWVTGPNVVRVRAQVRKTLVGGVQRWVGGGAEVQSLAKPSSMMPQAAPLRLSGCQNSHSLCQWPSCQSNRSSKGHMGASESRQAHIQSPGACTAWRPL